MTLSACDTGVGEIRNGEGVYGLRRAFVLAGAETLVMSLWPVSDAIARETMVAYYAGLRAGLGRGDALRQAKLAMLQRARPAAPVLLGQLHPVRRVGRARRPTLAAPRRAAEPVARHQSGTPSIIYL